MKSLKELYKIGRGPSSSHTMGPEKACKLFLAEHPSADRFTVRLLGSLSSTGRGHLTDKIIKEVLGKERTEGIFDDSDAHLLHPNTMIIGSIERGEKTDEWTV
ncbi:MAG: serine dehydratase, partial [Clostridia bacterium]|nr:serine dehydratase [Clostridia bacterium]